MNVSNETFYKLQHGNDIITVRKPDFYSPMNTFYGSGVLIFNFAAPPWLGMSVSRQCAIAHCALARHPQQHVSQEQEASQQYMHSQMAANLQY